MTCSSHGLVDIFTFCESVIDVTALLTFIPMNHFSLGESVLWLSDQQIKNYSTIGDKTPSKMSANTQEQ